MSKRALLPAAATGARRRPAAHRDARSRRERLDLDGAEHAIVAGDSREKRIVYGYGFPSCPHRIKIGYSARGLTRILEQSTGFPEQPLLLFLIHDSRAKEVEKTLHAALAHKRADTIGVEWFAATLAEVVAASPHLRRALARRRRGGFRRRALVSLLGAAAGLALAPAASAFAALLLEPGPPRAEAVSTVRAALAALADLEPAAMEAARETLATVTADEAPVGIALAALAPAFLLALLPWRRRAPPPPRVRGWRDGSFRRSAGVFLAGAALGAIALFGALL